MCRLAFIAVLVALAGYSEAFGIQQRLQRGISQGINQVAGRINQGVEDVIDDADDAANDVFKRATNVIGNICQPPTMARALHNLVKKKVMGVLDAANDNCRSIMVSKFKYIQATCLPPLFMAMKGDDEDDGEEEELEKVANGGQPDEERLDLMMAGVRMFSSACKTTFEDLRDDLAEAGCNKGRDLIDFILFLPHKIMGYYFHKKLVMEVGYAKMNEYLEIAKDEMTPGSVCRNWIDSQNSTFLQNCKIIGQGFVKHIEFADKLRNMTENQCSSGGDIPPP